MRDDWRCTASIDAVRLRARLYTLIRDFFTARGVLEVETPMLSAAGNPDPNVESFSLRFDGPSSAGAAHRFLRTSPEFALKRLLACGIGDCYELGRVFRDGEAGIRHNPEFTMLEWYRLDFDAHRLCQEVCELLQAALALVGRRAVVEACSYRDLFRDRLGVDPFDADPAQLRAALGDVVIDGEGLGRDDWLDLLLTHRLQPSFAPDRILALHDFPASQCALARIRAGDPPLAERFEVYLGPLEIANGYHELTDADEQRRRFERDLANRGACGAVQPPIDAHLLAALQHGLPDCAGVALGIDRLLMALLDSERIDDVLAFPFGRA